MPIKISKSRIDLDHNRLDNALLKDCGEVKTAPAISAGTLTLDVSGGNVFEVSLNANITTFTISNPPPTGSACSLTLVFTADGTPRTVAWGNSIAWPGGTAPTLTSTSGQKDFFSLYSSNGGATWIALTLGQNFSPILAPVNTVAPAITGNAYVGQTLTASSGTWTGTATITYTYQWQHGTTNIGGATSSTYVISSSYIGETIRVVVTGANGILPNGTANSAATAVVAAQSQQAYITAQSTTWVCPAGVFSVSVVCVGAGGGRGRNDPDPDFRFTGPGGGALAYVNNFSVTPGNSYSVVVGAAGVRFYGSGGFSSFNSTTCKAGGGTGGGNQNDNGGTGGTVIAGTGGNGGKGGDTTSAGNTTVTGGGGAGGYAGNGGDGGTPSSPNGSNGATNSGAGGGGAALRTNGSGGGVGILGIGSTGTGGTSGGDGSPGSGGSTGTGVAYYGGSETQGAVRIIWPGTTRSFPSTNTADM